MKCISKLMAVLTLICILTVAFSAVALAAEEQVVDYTIKGQGSL